jgi:hypothetical protein
MNVLIFAILMFILGFLAGDIFRKIKVRIALRKMFKLDKE